jgi:hypothetical protein
MKLNKTQKALKALIDTADLNNPDEPARKAAEQELVRIGAVNADGEFISPNPNIGFEKVFNLYA